MTYVIFDVLFDDKHLMVKLQDLYVFFLHGREDLLALEIEVYIKKIEKSVMNILY